MKFAKANWERKKPPIELSQDILCNMVEPIFPNRKIESFELLNLGLANTNIRFKFSALDEYFVLRIYMQGKNALSQEVALAERFKDLVKMPEFLYVDKGSLGHAYAIQRWIKGKSLHEMFDLVSLSQVQEIAGEVAKTLSKIASQSFTKSGYFKENLHIIAFESSNDQHPFVSYMKDCLFENYSGRWLGETLSEVVWKFVLDNQSYFPSLEPACLVHGDFNPDNILIDEETFKVAGVLDWEFAFSGSYLFDIGTLLRFEVPTGFEQRFIEVYSIEAGIKFPENWHKMIKVQDLSNLIGLLNTAHECPNRIRDIKVLINDILVADTLHK